LRLLRAARGVTLIELVVVIVITAILSTMMAYFVVPMLLYSDAKRRAEMTDIADTALRRIGRDLRTALPNSVRVSSSGGAFYLELLLLRTGGRYRADTGSTGGTACPADGSSDPSILLIRSADSCFKTLGTVQNFSNIAIGDYLVVYNLQPGTTSADAYETGAATGGNKAKILALPTDEGTQARITFESTTFTYESPDQRFYLIEGPVTYVCDPGAQTLTRYWGYNISAAQATPPVGGSSALVASNVSACAISYDANVVAQSQGLVTLALGLSSKDLKGNTETVNLYYTVHVSNVP
jgi:MSHA biogenesis protein MshO